MSDRAEHGSQHRRSTHGPDTLRGDIGQDVAGRETSYRPKRKGHGRVEMRARQMTECVNQRQDDEAEREADADVSHGTTADGVDHDGAWADED
jgi:hypothetical protein